MAPFAALRVTHASYPLRSPSSRNTPRSSATFTAAVRLSTWEPPCYAQIGGLAFATFSTLILVPGFCSIAVKDLRIVKW